MSEKRVPTPHMLREIDFYGDTLIVAIVETEAFVALRPITTFLGLDWSAQRQRLLRDEVLSTIPREVLNSIRSQLDYLSGNRSITRVDGTVTIMATVDERTK